MITTYGSCVTVSFTGILFTVLQVYCNYIPPVVKLFTVIYSRKFTLCKTMIPMKSCEKSTKQCSYPNPLKLKIPKLNSSGMYWCTTMINVGSHSSQVCMFLTNC